MHRVLSSPLFVFTLGLMTLSASACSGPEAPAPSSAAGAKGGEKAPAAAAVQPVEAGAATIAEPAAPASVVDAQAAAAHRKAGRKLAKQDEWAAATIEFEQATKADPSSGRLACELGWAHFRAEHSEAARAELTRGIELLEVEAKSDEAKAKPLGACLYNLGRVAEAAHAIAEARALYQRSLLARPGNHTVEQRLAALSDEDPGDPPIQAAPTLACASGGSIDIDLAAWGKELEAARGGPEVFEALLAKLGLPGLPNVDGIVFFDPWADDFDEPGPDPQLRASVTSSVLEQGANTAELIHVSVTSEVKDGQADRVAVILTRPDQSRCLAGEVGHDRDMCSTSCLGDGPAFVLTQLPLVAADLEALRVDTQSGACCGSERGAEHETAFYGVENDSLVRYVGETLYSAWYVSPVPPVLERQATIELSGDFPKQIVVERETSCSYECSDQERAALHEQQKTATTPEAIEAIEDELFACGEDGQEECKPSKSNSTYRYQGGRYVD